MDDKVAIRRKAQLKSRAKLRQDPAWLAHKAAIARVGLQKKKQRLAEKTINPTWPWTVAS